MAAEEEAAREAAEAEAERAQADVCEAEANVMEHAAAVEGPPHTSSDENAALHIQRVMRGRAARKRCTKLRGEAKRQSLALKAAEAAEPVASAPSA
jgi:hypothetical protein